MWKIAVYATLVISYFVYTGFVYTSGTESFSPQTELSPEAKQGKILFQQHNCIACHQLFGLGGYLGPDLTNVISTKSEGYARVILENGTLAMPNFKLNASEINQLIAFLKVVDASGTSPPRSFEIEWDGTVKVK